MTLRKIATTADCPGSNCPTTYAGPDGMTYVQGYVVTDPAVLAEMGIPEGESVVAVPNTLLTDHVGAVDV